MTRGILNALNVVWSVFLAIAGGVTVLIAFLDFFGVDLLDDRQVWELTLLVAGAIATYLLFEKYVILLPMRKDMKALGFSHVLIGKPHIYGEGAARIFSEIKPEIVRVYASSGLWKNDAYKKQWLKAVKKAVSDGDIKVFQGVFGLPPTREGFTSMSSTLLELFDGRKEKIDNVYLRYLPPPREEDIPPMMGVIIMDTEWFAIGLACVEGDPIVDMTITHTSEQAASHAIEWFEKKIWRRCERERYILKEVSPEIPENRHVHLKQALDSIQVKFYKV